MPFPSETAQGNTTTSLFSQEAVNAALTSAGIIPICTSVQHFFACPVTNTSHTNDESTESYDKQDQELI